MAIEQGTFTGTPRAEALAELALRMRALLESFLSSHGAERPASWEQAATWLCWGVADGVLDAATLVVRDAAETRVGLFEIVDAAAAPAASPLPPRPALSAPSVGLYSRATAAWTEQHRQRFVTLGLSMDELELRGLTVARVEAMQTAGPLALVVRTGFQRRD